MQDKAIVTYFQPKEGTYAVRKALAKDVRKEVARFIDADLVNLYNREPDENFKGLVIAVGGDGAFIGSTHTFRNPDNTYLLVGAEGKSLSAYAQSNHSTYKQDINKIINNKANIIDALRVGAKTNDYESWHCVNDIVIGAGSWGTMFEYSLEIAHNGKKVTFPEGRGTSILFSTPHGSTAYALSAGGPVVDRDLEAILIVPESPNKAVVANKRVPNCYRDLENLITPYVLQPDVKLTLEVKRKSMIVPDGRAIDAKWIEPETKVSIQRRQKAKFVTFR